MALLAKDQEPHLRRKGLPGDPDDLHSRSNRGDRERNRYRRPATSDGNPCPGPKFDYKLRWFERLHDYAAELLAPEVPVVLAGDYNVMPGRSTSTSPSAG
ncbi:endonuclease/exonuclease/phosphatase family protein [Rhizobium mongolense]|uniref:endonuclease/exonuclease/phosphatase family protein n=1 Tax=Rhizobium mongolense TaxID=57676 RepID=UPI0034A58FFF